MAAIIRPDPINLETSGIASNGRLLLQNDDPRLTVPRELISGSHACGSCTENYDLWRGSTCWHTRIQKSSTDRAPCSDLDIASLLSGRHGQLLY